MQVYIYQSDILCEACGLAVRAELDALTPRTARGRFKARKDRDDPSSYDSDEYPKGPYDDGGGEADTPCHCAAHEHCVNAIAVPGSDIKVGVMLENPLTDEGYRYARAAVAEASSAHQRGVTEMWRVYYDLADSDTSEDV